MTKDNHFKREKEYKTPPLAGPVCPLPLTHDEKIVLGHGSGGKMTQDLIKSYFLPEITNEIL